MLAVAAKFKKQKRQPFWTAVNRFNPILALYGVCWVFWDGGLLCCGSGDDGLDGGVDCPLLSMAG